MLLTVLIKFICKQQIYVCSKEQPIYPRKILSLYNKYQFTKISQKRLLSCFTCGRHMSQFCSIDMRQCSMFSRMNSHKCCLQNLQHVTMCNHNNHFILILLFSFGDNGDGSFQHRLCQFHIYPLSPIPQESYQKSDHLLRARLFRGKYHDPKPHCNVDYFFLPNTSQNNVRGDDRFRITECQCHQFPFVEIQDL
jgi:hypothetical protein